MRFSKAGSTFPRWPVRAANWPRVQSCRKVTKIFYAINAGRVFVFPEGADFDDFGKIHVIVFWTENKKIVGVRDKSLAFAINRWRSR
jgi:hypothetical protein